MKKFIFFAHLFTWLAIPISFAVQGQNNDRYPNYVVIGAFAHENNAILFTEEANRHNFPARFEMNPNRNLFYVYILTTADRELAFQEALKLRTGSKYFDTWVYCGLLGKSELAKPGHQDLDFNPATKQKLESIVSEQLRDGPSTNAENPSIKTEQLSETTNQKSARTAKRRSGKNNKRNALPTTEPVSENPGITGLVAATEQGSLSNTKQDPTIKKEEVVSPTEQNTIAPTEQPVSTAIQDPAIKNGKIGSSADQNITAKTENKSVATTKREAVKTTGQGVSATGKNPVTTAVQIYTPPAENTNPLTTEDVVGKNFLFKLYRAENHMVIEGEVDAIDYEKARRMGTYQANTPVKVLMPAGKSKQVSFVCQVFGYRKLQKEFDPNSPSEELYLDEQGNLVVPFELVRLQKGDIAIMYNVFFYKDAAVMRPESRYEVNNLLELLNENPSYKIKIHGHTNGNAPGKIIRMDKSGNFYSLTNTKEGFGSSKKLSGERSELMKQFLISSGIAENRMQIKAWGGDKPIHDKHSVRAQENVRVEIEILSE